MLEGLYHNQQCDGFAETYLDVEPTRIKDTHYDYQLVMDGMPQYQINMDDPYFTNHYGIDVKDNDRLLTLSEKRDILNTWAATDYFIAMQKEDPTSPINSSL